MPSAREFLLEGGAVPPTAEELNEQEGQEFLRRMRSGTQQEDVQAVDMISANRRLGEATRSATTRQEFVARNQEGEIPLDIDTGAPKPARFRASFRRDPESKIKFLQQLPGVQGVRQSDTGDIIVRVAGADGQPRDVLFDEFGLTLKDMIDMSGDSPEIAASIAAAFATGGASFGVQLGATAAAGFGVGAAKDAFMRAGESDIRPGEIAFERGKQELIGAALPLAGKGTKSLVNRGLAPFSRSAGPVERGALDAVSDIKGRTGIDIPLSAGQRTGSPSLIRAETFGENILGGGALGERHALQNQRVRELQQFLLETPSAAALPTEREIGEQAASTLTAQADVVASGAAAGRAKAAEQTSSSIGRELAGAAPNPAATAAGEAIRSRAMAAREAFRAQNRANYGAVFSAEGGREPFIPTAPLAQAADEIRERLKLAISEGKEVGTGVLDAAGREVKAAGEATEQVLTELVPPPIRPFLGIGGKLKEKITLEQAIAARSFLNDLVDEGAALPGIPDAYLKKLAGALTDSIRQGVDAAPNPQIKALLANANAFYKGNFAKFEEAGVRELFRGSTTAGHVPDAEIVGRITAGGGDVTQLRRMRTLLGPNSREFQAIRGAVADDVLRNSTTTGDLLENVSSLDASAFLGQLRGLNDEFADELLGKGVKQSLADKAKVLGVARNPRIDPDTARTILAGNTTNAADLIRLSIQREQLLDRVYHSRIMQRMVGGKLGAGDIDPSEFVTRMVGEASPAEMKQVMDLLASEPALTADIRRKAIQNVFQRAQAAASPEDIALRQAGQTSGKVSAKKMADIITADESKNLAQLIGPDRFALLQDYLSVATSQAKKSLVGQEAGSLVQAGIVSKLLQLEPTAAVKVARLKFASWLLSSDFLNFWAGSKAKLGPWPKLRTYLLASQPAARELADEFSSEPEALAQVLAFLRDEDPGAQQEPTPAPSNATQRRAGTARGFLNTPP